MAKARVRSDSCDSQEWEKGDGMSLSRSGLPRVSANAIAGRGRIVEDQPPCVSYPGSRSRNSCGEASMELNARRLSGRERSSLDRSCDGQDERPIHTNTGRRSYDRDRCDESAARAAYRNSTKERFDAGGDVRRASSSSKTACNHDHGDEDYVRRPSNRTRPNDDDICCSSNSNRKSFGQGSKNEEGTARQTCNSTRNSYDQVQATIQHKSSSKGVRRPSTGAEQQEKESDAETELFVENSGWQAISEGFQNGLPDKFRRPSNGSRASLGQIRGDAEDECPASGGIASYGQERRSESNDLRASKRRSYKELEGEIRWHSSGVRNSCGQLREEAGDVCPPSVGRKSYGQDQYGESGRRRDSNSKQSDYQDAEESIGQLSNGFQSARRPKARSEYQEADSDAGTEFFVEDRGWQQKSDAFPNGIPDVIRRPSKATRSSHGQISEDESNACRSSGGRKSFGQDRDDADDVPRTSRRSSYKHIDEEDETRRPPGVERSPYGQSHEGRRDSCHSSAGRKSYCPDRDGEIDARRVSNTRNSYDQDNEQGDTWRVSRNFFGHTRCEEDRTGRYSAGRKSHVQDFEAEGDNNQSSKGGRNPYARSRDEGDTRFSPTARNSTFKGCVPENDASCESYSRNNKQANEEGDIRRPSRGGRKSQSQNLDNDDSDEPGAHRLSNRNCSSRSQGHRDDSVRGRSDSRTESRRGSEQRMLSRAPAQQASEYETELFFEGPGWVKKSQAPRETLTLCLDADDSRQMASIIWDFPGPGAKVKAVGRACPEEGRQNLRPGDELFSISGIKVHKESRKYIESKWLEAQMEERADIVELVFLQW